MIQGDHLLPPPTQVTGGNVFDPWSNFKSYWLGLGLAQLQHTHKCCMAEVCTLLIKLNYKLIKNLMHSTAVKR